MAILISLVVFAGFLVAALCVLLWALWFWG
jgi:hypothetical protein